MRRWWTVLCGASWLPVLAGCGFSPLYGDRAGQAGSSAALGQISVALIPDRNGQVLREDLQERLGRDSEGVSSRYDLYVYLAIYGTDIAIDQQSANTHNRLNGAAAWTLKGQDAKHTTLIHGNAHALDGYDVINQQFFAADLSGEAAARRLDESLADQITEQIAVYFRSHPPT